MTEFTEFNLEDWIRDDEELLGLLNDALESGNQQYLLQILGIMAKRRGMAETAEQCSTSPAHQSHEYKAQCISFKRS